jgi:hypothetical protein
VTSTKIPELKAVLFFLTIIFLISFNNSNSQNTSAVINVNSIVNPNSKLLLGITFDARTGLTGNSGQIGYYNTDGTLVTGLSSLFSDFPFYSLRYPGQGIVVGFDWKNSIGLPASSRPPQSLLGSLGSSQAVLFGFDEFMQMVLSKGMSMNDMQIMVPIYDTLTILDPARWNADWVEYANAIYDSSNSNGGIDWAAVRHANGRTQPYGIKIWNIGNEPWSTSEYGGTALGCANFLSDVTPIIDSMLAADPTIKITLPTVGGVSSGWNTTIKNSALVSQGKIYGISPHNFPNETVNGMHVSNIETAIKAISDTAARYGLKVILGDYSHNIPNGSPAATQDLAMQWQGANLSTDFLLLMSQISNVERVNFWAYGLPPAVYHPIRYNSPGNYTLMPVADLYKKLSQVILEQSISVTSTSSAGSDGNPYAVRTSAFSTSNLSHVNVVSVNRDRNDTVSLQLSGVSGYNLLEAKLLSASGPSAEVINESSITADSLGKYSLLPLTVLILKYISNSLPVELSLFTSNVYGNNVQLKWSTVSELNNKGFSIERTKVSENLWSEIKFVNGAGTTTNPVNYSIEDKNLATAKYKYRLKQIDYNGNYKYYDLQNEVEIGVPAKFELGQNYPNPFNPTTKINFSLHLDTKVLLKVYDLTGRELSTLVNGELKPAGYYSVEFSGNGFASGLYIYRIQTDKESVSKKMVLVK